MTIISTQMQIQSIFQRSDKVSSSKGPAVCVKFYLQIPFNCHIFECFRGNRCELQTKKFTKQGRKKKQSPDCCENCHPY